MRLNELINEDSQSDSQLTESEQINESFATELTHLSSLVMGIGAGYAVGSAAISSYVASSFAATAAVSLGFLTAPMVFIGAGSVLAGYILSEIGTSIALQSIAKRYSNKLIQAVEARDAIMINGARIKDEQQKAQFFESNSRRIKKLTDEQKYYAEELMSLMYGSGKTIYYKPNNNTGDNLDNYLVAAKNGQLTFEKQATKQ